tara:strand:- start:238 stop:678 length:441 start_codon:yes stop_codon:yes gene_type:complete
MIINLKELLLKTHHYDDLIYLYNLLSNVDSEEFTFEKFQKFMTNLYNYPNHNIYGYFIDNKIVGIITLLLEQKIIHNGKYVGHIEDLVVNENYRCQGISRCLLEYVIEISKMNDCYKCILDCVPDLEEHYKKNGFYKKGYYMAKYF